MRYAVLDIGTNTVKLLVADCAGNDLRPVLETSETTRIGQGVSSNGHLLPEAISRTLAVIEDFCDQARKRKAERFLAFATSAVRDASNRDAFLDAFRQRMGFDCRVLSGNEEADLIFTGATSHPGLRDREVIVFDIGGGSMEFIRGRHGHIEFKVSLNCGAVRMTELFMKSDPPSHAELSAMTKHVLQALHSNTQALRHSSTLFPLLGTGGTISCLASMDLKLELPAPKAIDGHRFSLERLVEFRDRLAAMPLAERKQLRGLPPSRADIIVAGTIILVTGIQALGSSEITVSARNLRHGAVIRAHRETASS